MREVVLTEVALGVGILWALRQRVLQGVPGSGQVPEGVPGTAQQLARPAVHWIEVQGTPAHHCQYDARCMMEPRHSMRAMCTVSITRHLPSVMCDPEQASRQRKLTE